MLARITVAALLLFSVGCRNDGLLDETMSVLQVELERQVVPALETGEDEEAWQAFQEALNAAKQTGAHVSRGAKAGTSISPEERRLTSVVTIITEGGGACVAVSVRSTGEVAMMEVGGDPGSNCNDVTVLPF